MNAGPWANREEFEAWWRANVIALNRLAVTDPEEFRRVGDKIEAFNRSNPK